MSTLVGFLQEIIYVLAYRIISIIKRRQDRDTKLHNVSLGYERAPSRDLTSYRRAFLKIVETEEVRLQQGAFTMEPSIELSECAIVFLERTGHVAVLNSTR